MKLNFHLVSGFLLGIEFSTLSDDEGTWNCAIVSLGIFEVYILTNRITEEDV